MDSQFSRVARYTNDKQKFGNGAVRAGWLSLIIGIIAIFGTDYFASGDMSRIGMALDVCSLTIL